MYKYLLCWRYLRTRYIALASVISVMLGVATMIVVNSVMAGFAEKMRDRLHGVLADVVVESYSLDGFYNSEEVMARVKQVGGDDVDRAWRRPWKRPGSSSSASRRPGRSPARSRSSASSPRSGPRPAISPSFSSTTGTSGSSRRSR